MNFKETYVAHFKVHHSILMDWLRDGTKTSNIITGRRNIFKSGISSIGLRTAQSANQSCEKDICENGYRTARNFDIAVITLKIFVLYYLSGSEVSGA
jgi:hypothetical protein